MIKKVLIILTGLGVLFAAAGCGPTNEPEAAADSKVKVSVTFDAMKEFVEAVGQDKVEITTMIPTGTEPHDFEPKAQDLTALSSAQILVYNGLGMENWIDNAVSAAANENLIVVAASDGVEYITNTDEAEISEHGQYDPHTWLSLKAAQIEVGNIKNALITADPDNAEYYEDNYTAYIQQLEDLYQEYAVKFASLSKKSFVTGHAAFAYLCRDFGLAQNSVEDVFAEGEPTAQQLAELVDYCRTNSITTIFAEEMASPEISATLAEEVNAKVETIYTIESSEDDLSYLARMESNLNKIYLSLSE